jgi:S1-C subfamily serine protease/uncharacterized membrane protein required for colicin V production
MNWLDLFIILFAIAAIIRGLEVGFVRQFFSTFGFFAGLFLGALIEGLVINHVHGAETKALVALLITMGSAISVMTLGEYAGLRLKFKLRETHIAEKLDTIFGSALAGLTVLLAVWLGASIFRGLPDSAWQRQLQTSRIISTLDSELPSAPGMLARLGHLIDPNGFPQVFTGLEPSLPADTPLPDMGALNAAVEQDRPSVVKIEGEGCGGVVEGSGFVASDGLVITNAHVVAGVERPVVIDQGGQHRATPVWFDPDLDLAVLKTNGLAGKPLPLLSSEVNKGTPGAVLGYPGGGGFSGRPAAILDAFNAVGRNIYNQSTTERRIYSMRADIQQGNSGGPVIDQDGAVIGVVFAKSTAYNQVGYALTMDRVIQDLNQAKDNMAGSVSTGNCAQ